MFCVVVSEVKSQLETSQVTDTRTLVLNSDFWLRGFTHVRTKCPVSSHLRCLSSGREAMAGFAKSPSAVSSVKPRGGQVTGS